MYDITSFSLSYKITNTGVLEYCNFDEFLTMPIMLARDYYRKITFQNPENNCYLVKY
jgi:hypothetical protein